MKLAGGDFIDAYRKAAAFGRLCVETVNSN